ncbi:MAG: hypothetical protein NT077_02830 [Candidatus Taylorbacteria bacterium]|nr:hypothetical protein [Candidatus Taylorbacteria bacterium]
MDNKYWLIGGVVGAAVYGITGIGLLNLGPINDFLYLPLMFVIGFYGPEVILPIGIVTGLIIGSIIGWLFGRVMNRNKVVPL